MKFLTLILLLLLILFLILLFIFILIFFDSILRNDTKENAMPVAAWICLVLLSENSLPGNTLFFHDDFSSDPLLTSPAQGVTWQKGSLKFGRGAAYARDVHLGHTAEINATIQLPAGAETAELRLALQGPDTTAQVSLARE